MKAEEFDKIKPIRERQKGGVSTDVIYAFANEYAEQQITELETYIEHKHNCEYSPEYLLNKPCSCGLNELLDKH